MAERQHWEIKHISTVFLIFKWKDVETQEDIKCEGFYSQIHIPGSSYTSRKGEKLCCNQMFMSTIWRVENVPVMSTWLCKHKSHKAVSHSLQAEICSVRHSQEPGRGLTLLSQAHTGELLSGGMQQGGGLHTPRWSRAFNFWQGGEKIP